MNNAISGSMIIYSRCRRHVSQKDLAEVLGVSARTLRKIERGEKVPDEKLRGKIVDYFGEPERFENCWRE